MTATHLDILEVGEVCAAQRAHSLDLFELLGRWVTTTPPGPAQRVIAAAGHRHAWHADLWAQRCPTIPAIDLEARTRHHRGRFTSLPDLVAYGDALAEMVAELAELAARCDPDLDPSTTRTISLVATDLRSLRSVN